MTWKDELNRLLKDIEEADFKLPIEVEGRGIFEIAKRLVSQLDIEKLRGGNREEKAKCEGVIILSRLLAEKVLEGLMRTPPDVNTIITEEAEEYLNTEDDLLGEGYDKWEWPGYAARYLDVFGRLAEEMINNGLYEEGLKLTLTIPWFRLHEVVAGPEFILDEEDIKETAERGREYYGTCEHYIVESSRGRKELEGGMASLAENRMAVWMNEVRLHAEFDLRSFCSRSGNFELLATYAEHNEKALKAVIDHLDELTLWDRAIIASNLSSKNAEHAMRIYPDLKEAFKLSSRVKEMWC